MLTPSPRHGWRTTAATARPLLTRVRRRWSAAQVHTTYALVPTWTPPIEGLGIIEAPTCPLHDLLGQPIIRDALTALQRLGLSHASLLDFGCGTGQYQALLAANPPTATWTYVGVDRDAAEIARGRQASLERRLVAVVDGEPLPFVDEAFEVVLASGVLQYIEHAANTLRELRRVTTRHVVITRLPTWKYHATSLVVQSLSRARARAHYPMRIYTRCHVERLFARCGLAVQWRDYGSEMFRIPGIQEPVMCLTYLLRKAAPVGDTPCNT